MIKSFFMRTVFALVKVFIPLVIFFLPLTIYITDFLTANGIPIPVVISKEDLLEIARAILKVINVDVSIKLLENITNFVPLVLTIAIGYLLRKFFKNKLFNNWGNLYYDIPYFIYFLAGKFVLNYGEISLVRVPQPLQFKIVAKNIFSKIAEEDFSKVDNEEINVVFNDVPYGKTVNLVLSDTFHVLPSSLPDSIEDNYTVYITRNLEGDPNRKFSPEFVSTVRREVEKFSGVASVVNIFPYINGNHTKHITESCFKVGGRNAIKKINVYQPNKNKEYRFENPLEIKLA